MEIASSENTVKQLLFEVAKAQAAFDLLREDVRGGRESLIPEQVQEELLAWDEEHAPALAEGEQRLAGLKKQARLAATQHGETVKGECMQAVVYEQVTWDDAALRRFLAYRLNPRDLGFALELRTCKTVCQVRGVK